MLKSYVRLALRHLTRSKSTGAINIAGLAIGMSITLLIGLWIVDESSFDHYAPDHARLVQAMVTYPIDNTGLTTDDYVCMPLGAAVKQYGNLFAKSSLVCNEKDRIIAAGNTQLSAHTLYGEYQLAEMFGFQMQKGSTISAKDPSTALIAQSLATALFGATDPIGKTIKVDNKADLTIGGVYADLPNNTTFHAIKAVLPWFNKANSYHNSESGWNNTNGHLYLQLATGVTPDQASQQIQALLKANSTNTRQTGLVYPMDRVHLHGDFTDGKPSGGRIRFVRLFGLIGAFVLLLACINFMNLSTARSQRLAKEVGIRKTIGSQRHQLITQFLCESVLVTFLALAIALLLTGLALPFFNQLAAKDIRLPWINPIFWTVLITFTILTGLIAGSYPALFLSGFSPIKTFKKANPLPRKILITLQFTVSLTLIIGTIVVFRQIDFVKDRPAGFSRDGLITIDLNTPDLQSNYDALRTELLAKNLAANVTAASMDINDYDNNTTPSWRGKPADMSPFLFNPINVTPEYGKTIGWSVIQGRDFSRDFTTDSNAVILNEAAVALIGIKNILGETIKFGDDNFHVIGVVKNMVSNSPYDRIDPAAFLGNGYKTVMTVRIRPGAPIHATLAAMQPVFKKYNPGSPFLYHFVDEVYATKFESEERIGNLASVFATLAVFISCLGLFGLAAFVAEQRTKEIGVRKVLGASITNLWALLSKDFLQQTILSIAISTPIAYLAMRNWLQGYQYHTPLSWWIFAAAGAGIIIITLITVSYQSLKAAFMNPITSLRSE